MRARHRTILERIVTERNNLMKAAKKRSLRQKKEEEEWKEKVNTFFSFFVDSVKKNLK